MLHEVPDYKKYRPRSHCISIDAAAISLQYVGWSDFQQAYALGGRIYHSGRTEQVHLESMQNKSKSKNGQTNIHASVKALTIKTKMAGSPSSSSVVSMTQ